MSGRWSGAVGAGLLALGLACGGSPDPVGAGNLVQALEMVDPQAAVPILLKGSSEIGWLGGSCDALLDQIANSDPSMKTTLVSQALATCPVDCPTSATLDAAARLDPAERAALFLTDCDGVGPEPVFDGAFLTHRRYFGREYPLVRKIVPDLVAATSPDHLAALRGKLALGLLYEGVTAESFPAGPEGRALGANPEAEAFGKRLAADVLTCARVEPDAPQAVADAAAEPKSVLEAMALDALADPALSPATPPTWQAWSVWVDPNGRAIEYVRHPADKLGDRQRECAERALKEAAWPGAGATDSIVTWALTF